MPEKKKPKVGSGKSKGSSFERDVSSKLSLWFSYGERDDIFYRSHSSGARFTSRKKSKKDTAFQSGDITCSDPIGEDFINKVTIECKTGYGKWDVLDSIDSKQKETTLEKFWAQCQTDSVAAGKEPVLIFRRPLRQPCVLIWKDYLHRLENYFGKYPFKVIYSIYKDKGWVAIMSLADFLEWAEPQNWIKK
jgi:hypothetical protein